ncbi:MAG: hypothetical protein EOO91_09250 [Pedobacter sp.]|nr:MAG: hypothetical protein EOO91_09250 [Pedobacter sp.]
MFLRKYRVLIVIAFMGIFTAKMVISGAPVFFAHLDKSLMNAVIMQLEAENNGEDSGKGNVKFAVFKIYKNLTRELWEMRIRPLLGSK